MTAKILVVDDDPAALKLISYTLRREGYEVSTAADGMEALTLARHERFDLIILDIMMPGMDGYEVCRRLRANPQTAGIPIIMLTARSQVRDKVSGFRSGTDEYITKPLLPHELVSRVKALLLRASLTRTGPGRAQGRTLALVGAKGGVGTTSLALNLAYLLAQEGKAVILADLSPNPLALMQLVDVEPSQAVSALLSEETPDLSARRLEPLLVEVNKGLRVLPSPPSGSLAAVADGALLETMHAHLASLAEFLLVDLGAGLHLPTSTLLPQAEKVVLVSESTRLGLALAREGWKRLTELALDQERVEVVMVNRTRGAVSIRAPDAARALGRDAVFVVAVPELAEEALASHVPIAISQPDSLYALQVKELLHRLLGTGS
ncbi:MAG: response regulator [Anaerolineae bacterium]|nr:response regulator [Anaerolineae bacterium]